MNKVLRTALVAVMGMVFTVAAKAQAVGDQIALGNKVYKVASANIIANPGFEDGFTGWTSANDFATELTAANFELRTEDGHGNFLVGKANGGSAAASSIGTAWAIDADKTYYFAYDVKKLNTNPDTNGSFLKSSLTDDKGVETVVLGTPELVDNQWAAFQTVFVNDNPYAFAQVMFRWLNGQFGFDNFRLFQVSEIDQEVVDAYNGADEYWRAKNLAITKLANDYADVVNAIVTGELTVQAVMDKANLAINQAWETYNDLNNPADDATRKTDALAAFTAAMADADAALEAAQFAWGVLAAIEEIPAGKYYIQETTTGKYLGPGNSWGTHASLVANSVEWTLALKDGKYTLEGPVKGDADTKIYLGGPDGGVWCDGEAVEVVLSKVGEGLYTIKNGDNYYCISDAAGYQGAMPVIGLGVDGAQFKIVAADVTKAKKDDNVSYLVKDADFGRNNRYQSAWTVSEDCTNKNLGGGAYENFCAESYHSPFTISQKVSVPNGFYTVTAQAFYRQEGSDDVNLPVLFANKRSNVFPVRTGTENSMGDASASFAAGNYTFQVEVYVANGEIELGFKNKNTNVWAIFDNVGLIYRADDATLCNAQAEPELSADTIAMEEAWTAAKTTLAALPTYAQEAVKEQVAAIEADTLAARLAVRNAIKAQTQGKDQDELEAQIADVIAEINACVAAANKVVADNNTAATALNDAYDALVAEWQDAYDKINTKYREYLNEEPERYQSYLSHLNSIYVDIDALGTTIQMATTDGTAIAMTESLNNSIANLSQQIKDEVAGALADYEDEVKDFNTQAKADLDKLAADKTKAYKDAILEVSDHYAKFHPEAADDAQVALFQIFEDIQTVKAAYAAEYAQIEKNNATKFANEDLPLTKFNTADYVNALNAIDLTVIEATLAAAEVAAAADNNAAYIAYTAKVAALARDTVALKNTIATYGFELEDYEAALQAAEALIEAFKKAVEDDKVHFHPAVEANPAAEPPVEAQDAYITCLIEDKATIDAAYDAAKAEVEKLQAAVKADKNAELMADLNKIANKSQKLLNEISEGLDDYDAVFDAYEEDIEAVQTHIDNVKAKIAAEGADFVKDNYKLYDQIKAELGDTTDFAILPATAMDPVTVDATASNKYSAAVVKVKIGDADPSDNIVGYKLGTGSSKGRLVLNMPIGATGFTFAAATWNTATADDNMTVKVGETTLKTIENVKANAGIVGNSPYTVSFADAAALAAATYEVEFPAALTEETAITLEMANEMRFVIWSLELEGGPAAPSVVQELNALRKVTKNETLNIDYAGDIATLKKNLADADAIAKAMTPAQAVDVETVTALITNLEANIKTKYEAVDLLANKALFDGRVEDIQDAIDDELTVVYKNDLQNKMLDLKKKFNDVSAEVWAIDTEISKDDLWQQIVDEDGVINALTDIDAKKYEEHVAIIANIGLQFTDYAQWIEKNTVPGDITLDGEVTISDVVKMVGVLVNTDNIDAETGEKKDIDLALSGLTQRAFWAADVNGDKKLDGADLALVIDLMLGKEIAEPAAGVREESATDYLVLDGANLALVNTREYVNFELIVKVADGSDLSNVATTARTAGMQILTTKTGNFYKIFVYSANNTAISDNEGSILTLGGEGITITSAEFVAAGYQSYNLDVEDVTGIRGINATNLEGADIYTVAGAKSSRLQKGVNVIRMADGTVKKVLVK